MYYAYGFDPQIPIKTDLEVFICDSRTQKMKLRRQEIQSHSQLPKWVQGNDTELYETFFQEHYKTKIKSE